jgi:hypothetical protein
MRKNILETFEGFTKDNLDYLVNNKKTYVRKEFRDIPIRKIQKIVKEYDISNFKFIDKGYGIFIYPDNKFIELIKELDPNIDNSLFFYITVTGDLNYVDFAEGIPPYLRGLSLAYKFYKMIIKMNGFICSDRYSTLSAWNLWYSLLQDDDLYAITSNLRSCLIDKNITNDKLKEVINKVSENITDIEYSEDLKERLKIINNDE